ncbi:MAG: DUF4923 family protein [Bacteroidales bacterium]|nr:DUF4923 family protein [Bacteroidales bacterium]
MISFQKRLLIILTACLLAAGNCFAQITPEGSWLYSGLSINLLSDNFLANLASSSISGTINAKAEDLVTKVGFKKDTTAFVFNDDGSFLLKLEKMSVKGRWGVEENSITLLLGPDQNVVSITGEFYVNFDQCEMSFTSEKFLQFIRYALSVAGTATESREMRIVSELLKNFNSIRIGFKMKGYGC